MVVVPLSMPAPHTTAVPSVDLETLLWELRDLLRGLVQVNAVEAAQLAQLVPTPATFEAVSTEYAERAHAALDSIDLALEQLQLAPTANLAALGDDNVFDSLPIRDWLHDTLLAAENATGELQEAPSTTSDATAIDQSNFWNTDASIKWDEEPEEEPTTAAIDLDPERRGADLVSVFSDDSDDVVTPWDSVSMRDEISDADTESDSELEEVQQSRWSSSEETATICYSEPPQYDANITPVLKKFVPFGFGVSMSESLSFFAHRAALAGL